MAQRKRLKLKIDPEKVKPLTALKVKLEKKRANPRLITDLEGRLTDQFCNLIRRGLPTDGVCDYLGITNASFWVWTAKGRRYLDGNGTEKVLEPYGHFVLALKRATAEYRMRLVDRLHEEDLEKAHLWKRDMAILERRDRKTFSKSDPTGGNEETLVSDERFL